MKSSKKLLVIGRPGLIERYTPNAALYADYEVVCVPVGTGKEEILAAAGDARYVICDAIAEVSGDLIRSMPDLKIIHSNGVAFNRIDVEAARERQVYVCNCKGMNAAAVAEQAVLLMTGLLRGIVTGDRALRDGRQIRVKEGYMAAGSLKELGECTVGLVGFGDIARATARLLGAYGAAVCYYDVFRAPEQVEQEYGAVYRDLDELLASSDLVSLHLPVLKETVNMVDRAFLARMKKGAYLVNTARGELVDEAALLDSIRRGHIAGAGLDTVTAEPVAADHPILQAEPEVEEKLLFSCHIGGITGASFCRGYEMIWADFAKVAAGKKPDHVVNDWE